MRATGEGFQSRQLTRRSSIVTGSKSELQSELNLPRRRDRCSDCARGATRWCSRSRKFRGSGHSLGKLNRSVCLVGHGEVRVIKDVEHLGAEVQCSALSDCELLEEREIEVHQFGTDNRIPTEISHRVWGWQHECLLVKPMSGIALDGIVRRPRRQIWTFMHREINRVHVSRPVEAEPRLEWRPRLNRIDAIELPPLQECSDQPLLVTPKRKFVTPVRYENVLGPETREAPVCLAVVEIDGVLGGI